MARAVVAVDEFRHEELTRRWNGHPSECEPQMRDGTIKADSMPAHATGPRGTATPVSMALPTTMIIYHETARRSRPRGCGGMPS